MRHKIVFFITLISGMFLPSAQTLTPSEIWHQLIPKKFNTDSLLTQKGFKIKYSGPKKLGGNLSCYFNKKYNEWIFIHDNEQEQTTSFSYLLPTLKKYKNNQVEKKLLVQGEKVAPMGKTYHENKLYYHLIYTFENYKASSLKE
ncbi:Uncharacterised protein [Chryseobacterium nakagawai]|uniref:Beta-lactamase-inhibitor-like PepSY-like domain-containing protein n=1 Tax=Chryseobacterium nakagawai TaxID=1241982 RepID=A0AAD1DUB7_CHRNA|nr:hypothetical protein [Chryseobacterium nakagawai]AZA93829.1 hypothetical protein EG343_06515 [Chryseobacterium nakagawai]VEH21772.1 Uncharacterised protein [Chryseobacterium nakagawai]